jgi:3-dehydroquinate dehydratase/shikimate dehydrogenase
MTYLAVSIAAQTIDSAAQQVKAAKKAGAEMIELRTDYLTGCTVESAIGALAAAQKTSLPVIVTCRDIREGGAQDLPLELRAEILCAAVAAGADFIDCEFANYTDRRMSDKLTAAMDTHDKAGLILSAHDFAGPFEKPQAVYEEIVSAVPWAIPKIVYTAGHINDCFSAFDLLIQNDRDAIVLCMGQAGLITRLLAKKLGGFVTFACLDDESRTAPGQVTLDDMKNLYRWDAIDEQTEVFGVIGSPVGHSMSPAIFNACFDKQEINALYVPLLVEGTKEEFFVFLANIISRGGGGGTGGGLGFGGFSVTIPHKTNAFDYVTHSGEFVEPLAQKIGSINTLKVGFGGIISGYNTDYAGAMNALTTAMGIEKHDLHKSKVAVVGAGGVARALVAGLTGVGADITIYNRTVSKARALADEFGCKIETVDRLSDMDAQIVINCTSIGMSPNTEDTPVPKESLKRDMVVFDTVYNPMQTRLLAEAAQLGAKTISGVDMFVSQAAAQYNIFIGTEPDEDLMRRTVVDRLGQ